MHFSIHFICSHTFYPRNFINSVSFTSPAFLSCSRFWWWSLRTCTKKMRNWRLRPMVMQLASPRPNRHQRTALWRTVRPSWIRRTLFWTANMCLRRHPRRNRSPRNSCNAFRCATIFAQWSAPKSPPPPFPSSMASSECADDALSHHERFVILFVVRFVAKQVDWVLHDFDFPHELVHSLHRTQSGHDVRVRRNATVAVGQHHTNHRRRILYYQVNRDRRTASIPELVSQPFVPYFAVVYCCRTISCATKQRSRRFSRIRLCKTWNRMANNSCTVTSGKRNWKAGAAFRQTAFNNINSFAGSHRCIWLLLDWPRLQRLIWLKRHHSTFMIATTSLARNIGGATCFTSRTCSACTICAWHGRGRWPVKCNFSYCSPYCFTSTPSKWEPQVAPSLFSSTHSFSLPHRLHFSSLFHVFPAHQPSFNSFSSPLNHPNIPVSRTSTFTSSPTPLETFSFNISFSSNLAGTRMQPRPYTALSSAFLPPSSWWSRHSTNSLPPTMWCTTWATIYTYRHSRVSCPIWSASVPDTCCSIATAKCHSKRFVWPTHHWTQSER